MTKYRLRRQTWALLDLEGMHISSLYQLPLEDNRKLKLVAQPSDPWVAQLFYGDSQSTHAEFISWAKGPTADDAVLSALKKAQGLEGRYRKLAAEIASLGKLLRYAGTKIKAP